MATRRGVAIALLATRGIASYNQPKHFNLLI